jgi:hypothetical protein
MLNQHEREAVEKKLLEEQKNTMKVVLNNIRMALDDSRFEHFKKTIFNSFGKSGLESSTKNILDEFTEKSKE